MLALSRPIAPSSPVTIDINKLIDATECYFSITDSFISNRKHANFLHTLALQWVTTYHWHNEKVWMDGYSLLSHVATTKQVQFEVIYSAILTSAWDVFIFSMPKSIQPIDQVKEDIASYSFPVFFAKVLLTKCTIAAAVITQLQVFLQHSRVPTVRKWRTYSYARLVWAREHSLRPACRYLLSFPLSVIWDTIVLFKFFTKLLLYV